MKHPLLIAFTLLVPFTAQAESLKEKEQRKRENEILQKSTREMNEVCKTNITSVGDWATFNGALSNDARHVGLNCAFMVLDTIRSMCISTDEAKQAVRAGITTFRCQGGGDADISLRNKVLIFKTRVDSEKSDVPKMVREYLKARL